MKRALKALTFAFAALMVSDSAFAQGCSQCLTYASAAGKRAQSWLDFGIAVLLFPTLILFAGILLLFVRRARAADSAIEAVDLDSEACRQEVPAPYAAALNSSATRPI